jgi:hypothetical protein
MKKHSVILIATSGEQSAYHPAHATIALATISHWLKVRGIADTAMFPEDGSVNVLNAVDSLKAFLEKHSAPLIGISCWSSSFSTASMYSALIRRMTPGTILIGGGVHFNTRDNIKNALNSEIFDIVFSGGADPFFEFMESVESGGTKVRRTPQGLSVTGPVPSSGFCIKGGDMPRYGRLTVPVAPVVSLSDTDAQISVLFSDFCSNGCDYCTVYMNKTSRETRVEAVRMVEEAYKQIKSVSDVPVNIAVMDSSPFLEANRADTEATLETLSALGNDISYTVFADPLDLDNTFDRLITKYNITAFFFGRDRISKDSFVGRRWHGRLRTLEILNTEKEHMAVFIEKMARGPVMKEIYIGYIASPFDTMQEADMLIDEIDMYMRAAGGKAMVRPSVFILNPYIGTKVHKRAADKVWDISEFFYPYPNVWHSADTRMVWLELVRLVVSPLFSAGNMPFLALAMLRFARDYEFGERKPAVLPEDLYPAVKDTASKIMDDIIRMDLGNEKTLEGWFSHLEEIYFRGFLLAGAAMNREQFARYGADTILQHIKRSDAMIHRLRQDFKFITSKNRSGSWYDRF